MFVLPLILAAGSFSTLISGAPVPSFLSNVVSRVASSLSLEERTISLEERSTYTVYGGTGDLSDGWPSTSAWVSDLDTMFESNTAYMSDSCTQWGVANPTTDELADVKSAISSVASSTGVDARFILAIVMQESNGCVRAPTTNYGVVNPGLMQSHAGTGTCNDGTVQNPCPSSEITQMIQDGAGGTSAGDGLQQCITQSGATDDSKYYKAARIYNSGSISTTKNLGAGIATHCYASDVANRLVGWNGSGSTCVEGTVALLTGTVTTGTSGSSSAVSSASVALTTYAAPPPSSTQAAKPTTSAVVVAPSPSTAAEPSTTAAPSKPAGVFAATAVSVASSTVTVIPQQSSTAAASSTSTSAASSSTSTSAAATSAPAASSTSSAAPPPATTSPTPVSTTAELYPYADASCKTYYTVVANDYCILVTQKTGVSMANLQAWNGGLDDACSNLWLGYQYCVGV